MSSVLIGTGWVIPKPAAADRASAVSAGSAACDSPDAASIVDPGSLTR